MEMGKTASASENVTLGKYSSKQALGRRVARDRVPSVKQAALDSDK